MKLKQAIQKSIEAGVALSAIAVLMLAGCGGGASGAGVNGTSPVTKLSTASFLKSSLGNHWTWSGNSLSIYTDASGVISTVLVVPSAITTTVSSVANGAALMSSVGTVNGSPSTVLPAYRYIDATTGNLMNAVSSVGAVPSIILPATFGVGTTWTRSPATATESAVPATITATNVTRTVPAGTFNDCVQVTAGPSLMFNGSAMVTVTHYLSPSVGHTVETSTSITTLNTTYTGGTKLEAGYVAK